MVIVSVCVGSACHLKGSHSVISRIESLIDENKLQDKITLKAAFCIGECTRAVSVKVDEEIYSVNEKNVDEFFNNAVLGRL
ncbi:MAG: (2Fe-2S) ferredoxin protein [Clostridiales bacterium]|jgi:NADH:ubiquinone oxidoreductase subunit E|nr:(2Fe-2S) ferredoxin protein [Clostridiales bacterium]